MSKTKVFVKDINIFAVNEKSFEGKDYYEYVSENGDVFNSTKKFEVGDLVSVYLSKFNNNLTLNYSLKNE